MSKKIVEGANKKYYYSYMKSIKSQFIKTNMECSWQRNLFVRPLMGNIMIIFIVIALKLAQTFVIMAKYKLKLL
jgi:hypothetical protein